MPKATLTTKEVGRLLHVSEATVKRWADNGTLRSEKTAGGHRRFSIQAIARLRRELGPDEEIKSSGRPAAKKRAVTKSRRSPEVFLNSLLSGDAVEAGAALIDLYLNHQTLASIFDTTITKAMHEIGELWFKGNIT